MERKEPENDINDTDIQCNKLAETFTLPYNMVPIELRMPYILSGYRHTHQTWRYYLASIFSVHNETVNIWTVLIGAVLLCCQAYKYFRIYDAAGSALKWTVLCCAFCSVSSLMFSAITHVFHSKSPNVNYVLFLVDYLGLSVWLYGLGILTIYGISDPTLYINVKEYFLKWHCFFIILNYINMCAAKLWYGNDVGNIRRAFMTFGGIGAHFMLCSVPSMIRYYKCMVDQHCQISSLNHITMMCVMILVLGLLFSLQQPEKTWPGRFDIIGGSHQFFHMAVILEQLCELSALYTDFVNGVNNHCQPNIPEILIYLVTLAVVGLIILVIFTNLAGCHQKIL